MKKFLTYFITEQRLAFQNLPQILGTYVLIPLLLLMYMGNIDNIFNTPELNIKPIKINIENQDKSDFGQILVNFLKSEEMSKYIEIAEDAEYDVIIKENYGDDINKSNVVLKTAPNASVQNANIIQTLLEYFQQSMSNQLSLQGSMSKLSAEDAKNLQAELDKAVETASEIEFETEAYVEENTISPLQLSATSGILYLFILTVNSSVAIRIQENFSGLLKRLEILPLSPVQNTIYPLFSTAFTYSILAVIYMLVWKIVYPDVFTGNFLYYLMWIVIIALLTVIFSDLVNEALPAKASYAIFILLLLVYMVLSFLPADTLSSSGLQFLSDNNFIRNVFEDPINHYSIYKEIGNYWTNILGILATTSGLATLTIMIRTLKERRK